MPILDEMVNEQKEQVWSVVVLLYIQWHQTADTLRTSALALCYSVAEYCCPVWFRSAHTDLVDAQLNSSMRLLTK